jgi:hypothetical protein
MLNNLITRYYAMRNNVFKKLRRSLWSLSTPFLKKLGYGNLISKLSIPLQTPESLPETLWTRQSELVGLDMNDNFQLNLLTIFFEKYRLEYSAFPRGAVQVPSQFTLSNSAFGSVDAEVSYCMIRHFKPKRIIEIGSGNSTYLSAQAILKNKELDAKYDCELTAIEPYPNETLQHGFPGLSRLVVKKAEEVPLSEFSVLEENDILFIDSSHILTTGGDVAYEYLEVLPRVKRGVVVHCHDIFFPSEYPRDWVVKQNRYYSEQYLLQAFLSFNSSFKVLWAGSYMHFKHPDKLESAFSSYNKKSAWPGSIWLQRTE